MPQGCRGVWGDEAEGPTVVGLCWGWRGKGGSSAASNRRAMSSRAYPMSDELEDGAGH